MLNDFAPEDQAKLMLMSIKDAEKETKEAKTTAGQHTLGLAMEEHLNSILPLRREAKDLDVPAGSECSIEYCCIIAPRLSQPRG